MPWRYTIDAERGLVISTGWGRMTFAEMQAHQDQLASDPQFNPEFRQLVDATAITELNISIAEEKTRGSKAILSQVQTCVPWKWPIHRGCEAFNASVCLHCERTRANLRLS